jgi:3-mercaptopyruvate sulfurtransferase SseA
MRAGCALKKRRPAAMRWLTGRLHRPPDGAPLPRGLHVEIIDHRTVLRLRADGAQIVDALPSHEYDAAHIKGAIHLPISRLVRDARQLLAADRPVVVYCRDNL